MKGSQSSSVNRTQSPRCVSQESEAVRRLQRGGGAPCAVTHRGQAGGDDVGKNPLGVEQEIQSSHEAILRAAFGPPSSESPNAQRIFSPADQQQAQSHSQNKTRGRVLQLASSTHHPHLLPGTLLSLLKGRNSSPASVAKRSTDSHTVMTGSDCHILDVFKNIHYENKKKQNRLLCFSSQTGFNSKI